MIRRLLLSALAFAVFWGIPELLVRIADPPLEQYRGILFGRDENSPQLFMRDPRLHWKLRPDAQVPFKGRIVRTGPEGFQGEAPRDGERALLVLGDSTAFGWGVGQGESFADVLAARFDAAGARSEPPLRVLNAAVPGYSSHQVRLQAEALIPRWRPAVVIVCVGNNEAWPVARSDREVDARRRLAAAAQTLLSKSRFLVWASERLRPSGPDLFIAPKLEGSVVRVSVEEYAENLRAVARRARDGGARVILLGPPVNLYYPPDRMKLLPDAERWWELERRIGELAERGDLRAAFARANAAAAAEPEAAFPVYLQGMALTWMGRTDAGIERLEEALRRNPFPERCNLDYRQAAREVAQQERVAFLDVNELFREASRPDPRQAVALYLDWCHPTPGGHRLVAGALMQEIRAAK